MSEENQKNRGKIFTTLTIINRADQIRSLTLPNVLVDTRATTLCLPPDAIAKLGLKLLKEVDVATETDIRKARIFQDATLSMFDREGTFDCLELPAGRDALLGRIPLESLGLEIDLKNQTLKPLPISPTETYLTIL
jgi:predicted aspartyl protease